MDWVGFITAIAALVTAAGHAWNCKREIAELKSARDRAERRFERFAGDLSAFEKALEDSGRYKIPPIR